MRNRVINLTADATWQTLGADQNFPQNTYHIKLRTRDQVDMLYRWVGQDAYMTVPDGSVAVLHGKFDPGDLQVLAASGVIEIECSTLEYGGFD